MKKKFLLYRTRLNVTMLEQAMLGPQSYINVPITP